VLDRRHRDLRSDTADAATLGADLWLAVSNDGGDTWREARAAGPFDLATAPNARGLFLGDYHGLAASGLQFVPLFAQTTGATTTNRTDIFARPLDAPTVTAARVYRSSRPTPLLDAEARAAFDARVSDAGIRVLQARGRLPHGMPPRAGGEAP